MVETCCMVEHVGLYMLYGCTCCTVIHVVRLYMLYGCTSCMVVHVVWLYMLYTCTANYDHIAANLTHVLIISLTLGVHAQRGLYEPSWNALL